MDDIKYELTFSEFTALREVAAMAKNAGDLMAQHMPSFAPRMAEEAIRALRATDHIKPTLSSGA